MGIAEFVLIILFRTSEGAAVGSVEFNTLEACQAAEMAVKERGGLFTTVFTLCARK